ncbi:BCSC C-terminal domain-containing protein [Roseomonas sp. PWR1]|uniref:BCSC C-terminal domain-containing protein n=1 Tax=Roseomonas nitratireducens TaxID=2820810 RepID=A0ABS4ALX5_9PROT|nr:cellulose biosynthesis protein BcsC [Neoroseomonas nitratireducens]MBP0462364.1 BCSC C-terminal domain-containing protein [Neoroseomonas nitratireducens]
MRPLKASLLGAVAALALAGPAAAQPTSGALGILLQQARHWQEQNRPDLALRAYERVLATAPRNPEALAGAAEAQAALGNRTEAEALIARLRAVAPNATGVEEATRGVTVDRGLVEEARRLSRDGRVPEALTRYRDAFAGGPPTDTFAVEYWLTLAGTEGGWEEARRQLASFAARRPQDVRARVAAAQVLTYRESTRAQGIAQLAALSREPAAASQALPAWRQAVIWLGVNEAAEGPIAEYLAVRPDDGTLQRRLAEIRDPSLRAERAAGVPRVAGFQSLEANRLIEAARAFETALANNPQDADALGGLGVVRLRQGRVTEARSLLERAMAADPTRASNWRQAFEGASYSVDLAEAQALFRRGQTDAAEQVARRAAAREAAADRTDAEALLGDIALSRGDLSTAEMRFRAALARRPNFQPALQGLEQSLRRQSRTAEADEIARRIRVAAPATGGTGGVTAGNAGRLRAEASRAPDPATAAALLRAALAEAPNDPWVRLDLARALARQGQGAEGRAIIEAPLTEARAGSEAVFAAALFAEEQGRVGDAAALIGRVPPARRSPDMARLAARTRVAAEVEEAVAGASIGGFESRQRLLALAARQDPSGATPAAVIRAFGRIGDARGAEEAARVALAVNRAPSGPARLAIAGALLEAGQEQMAMTLVRGVEGDPSLPADSRRQAEALLAGIAVRGADRANEAGDQATGFERLRPALARNPQDPAANMALARLYAGARRPEEAQQIAESVLARDPRNLEARAGAVDAAIAARDYRRAEALVDEARALAPNEARVSLMQARLARARGDERGALRAAQLAQEQRRAQVGEVVPMAFVPGGLATANPFRSAGVTVGAPTSRDPLSAEIAREVERARDAASTRFTVAPTMRGRSGTNGLDRLEEVSIPLEASLSPRGVGGRLAATVTPVSISTGTLPGDLTSLQSFGANAVAFPGNMRRPLDDSASGVALGASYQRDWFRADVGSTPLGFRTQNVVGGVEVAPGLGGGWRMRVTGERRAVTDSLLSWSGARDGLTGQTWGGVVRTGGRAQVEYSQGPATFYAGGGYSIFQGENVRDNARVEAGAGMNYAVLRRPDEQVTVGLDLVYFAYDENLRFFSLGHGGYFSPQNYTAVNVPVDWRARSGDWSWRLGGSVGYAVWSEDRSPVFPNDPALQGALSARVGQDPRIQAFYPSQSEAGLIGSVRADVEYAMTPELALGATFRYDRSADWNEGRTGVYVRYRLPE